MDSARQKLFKPAVDRQSLEILAAEHSDQLLFRLLELNAVGNLCKAFLKEAEVDEILKICPLHNDWVKDKCTKDCAWWIDEYYMCSVTVLARKVGQAAGELLTISHKMDPV